MYVIQKFTASIYCICKNFCSLSFFSLFVMEDFFQHAQILVLNFNSFNSLWYFTEKGHNYSSMSKTSNIYHWFYFLIKNNVTIIYYWFYPHALNSLPKLIKPCCTMWLPVKDPFQIFTRPINFLCIFYFSFVEKFLMVGSCSYIRLKDTVAKHVVYEWNWGQKSSPIPRWENEGEAWIGVIIIEAKTPSYRSLGRINDVSDIDMVKRRIPDRV